MGRSKKNEFLSVSNLPFYLLCASLTLPFPPPSQSTMYTTERTTSPPHLGRIGMRSTLNSIKLRHVSSSTPILPPSDTKFKEVVPSLHAKFGDDPSSTEEGRDRESSMNDLFPKKKERKLFTKSRKKWRNVGRRFSSPFAGMLRSNRKSAKLKGLRGTLLLFHADTKQRLILAEQIENVGYNVEQHSMPDQAIGCLRTNSKMVGAMVAINSQLKHDTALEFLSLLDSCTDRLIDIPVALIPSEQDRQFMDASAGAARGGTGAADTGDSLLPAVTAVGNQRGSNMSRRLSDLEHLRRGMSINLQEARKAKHVRAELRVPTTEEEVELMVQRYEGMTMREIHATETYAKANRFDFEHQKGYLSRLEKKMYQSGHKVAGIFADRPRKMKKLIFKGWKDHIKTIKKEKSDMNLVAKEKVSDLVGSKGMVRGRKQGLFKRLRAKAKAVSTSRQMWQRTISESITKDRLVKRSILPTWLPLRMRKLYLADDTSERDLLRAVEIFTRMIRRRSEVWPVACRALAYCRLSEATNDAMHMKHAVKDLTTAMHKRSYKDRGDMYYNRGVVKLRQGHTMAALKDLSEVVELHELNHGRNVEEKFLEAALYNRQLIQRRFGNFIPAFADLTELHSNQEERRKKEQRKQKEKEEEEEEGEGEHNSDDDHSDDEEHAENSNPTQLTRTQVLLDLVPQRFTAELSPVLGPNKSLDRIKTKFQQEFEGVDMGASATTPSLSFGNSSAAIIRDTDSDDTSSSSSSSDDDDDDDDHHHHHHHHHHSRSRGGRRGSMIGNVSIKVNRTKKDDDDGQVHALDMIQQFSDTRLEEKEKKRKEGEGGEKMNNNGPPSHIETMMMTKKDKEKAIRNGVKHMFNKTLPSDVYDALQVPVEFRTRKHWRSIRFVTDTMSAFSKFPVALKDHLSKVLTLRNCHLNTYICHEGDEADNYYVIVSGYLRVEVQHPNDKSARIVVNRMGPGVSFGELSLVFDQQRMASVAVDSKLATLLIIPKDQFKMLGLAQFHLAKLQDKYQTLCQSSIFDSWTDEALTALAQIAQVKNFHQKKEILKQDSRPDYLHILRKGVVQIIARTDELGELRKEESALTYKIDRTNRKQLVSKLVQADKHVKESKEEEERMHKRLIVVKKHIKRTVMLPKPKAQTNIETLFAPAFFGESAVVAPNRGEPYTAIAETYCETLQIARPQIKSKWVTPQFVAALKRGMVRIPDGEELRRMEKIRNQWAGEKTKVCELINTSRHPKVREGDKKVF